MLNSVTSGLVRSAGYSVAKLRWAKCRHKYFNYLSKSAIKHPGKDARERSNSGRGGPGLRVGHGDSRGMLDPGLSRLSRVCSAIAFLLLTLCCTRRRYQIHICFMYTKALSISRARSRTGRAPRPRQLAMPRPNKVSKNCVRQVAYRKLHCAYPSPSAVRGGLGHRREEGADLSEPAGWPRAACYGCQGRSIDLDIELVGVDVVRELENQWARDFG